MKKCILILTCLLLILGMGVNESKAQDQPVLGIRAGVNYATILSLPVLGEHSPRIGFVGGVYGIIPIHGSSFSFQPEILYTQKGMDFPNYEITLNYIQIPIFARLDFADETLISPHLLLGPYIAFNIASKENPDASINTTVFGLAVGAGIDLSPVSIGIRYSQGISNIYTGSVEGRNSLGSIVIGYQF